MRGYFPCGSMRMKEIIKITLLTVILFGVAFGDPAAEESEPLNKAEVVSQPGDNPKYDFESLMIINLMEKAEFTVITSDGQKHRGHVEVTSDGLIVHKYDKIISGKDRLIAEKAIPFYQIQDIEYKPPNKVNLFKYFILGLTAITAVGVFAPH